jgi:hypothetical protein
MMDTNAAAIIQKGCPYCSSEANQIYHSGKCPKVKTIEYYENGAVKKVEFLEGW